MQTANPDLSIIIVNWNTRELLAACLNSLTRAIHELSDVGLRREDPPTPLFSSQSLLRVETIVVDNGSTDGSTAMIREEFSWVRLIENAENIGFARANNLALRRAQGRYLLLLNSDTEVRPGALQVLVAAFENHPQAGAVGPQMLYPDDSLQNSYGSLPTVLDELIGPYWADFLTKPWGAFGRRLKTRQPIPGTVHRVDRVSFACTMVRREALDRVGVLDERFEFYSEDYDWFKRLKKAGWIVLHCPQARVMHHWGASSSRRSDWSLRQLYRGKRLYFVKHHGRTSELLLRIGLMCRFAVKLALAAFTYPFRHEAASMQIARYRVLSRDMGRGLR